MGTGHPERRVASAAEPPRVALDLPAAAGWNCIYGADRDSLLAVVINAADQGSSCVVVDIAESY
jgi:hypothetical protein